MRVHELAKKKGLSSKEMLVLLKKAGIKVSSHMSALTDDDVAAFEKKAHGKREAKGGVAAVAAKPSVKKDVPPVKKIVVSTPKNASPASPARAKAKVPPISRGRRRSQARSASVRKPKVVPREITEIFVDKDLLLFEAAERMGKQAGELILALLKKGIACNRNHVLTPQTISELAHSFGIKVIIPKKEVAAAEEKVKRVTSGNEASRWPVVVVLGHVDHGKTTLLDHIRKMNVAAKEKGGITQHLSAWEVDSVHGKIVFLDTPGHEAFSYMRKRGARITDLAVMVIAVDDGIMPQTLEAIKYAKEAEVPILVALNKVDKFESPTAAIETVKRQLAEQDLLPEDWGGDVICVPISAKTGNGVEELLEMITLQAQMMELRADPTVDAKAFVLESKLDKGYGPVATVIGVSGTLKVGDYFKCGASTGKVRLLVNSQGERVTQAGPSMPVQVVGFDKFVSLGDWLTVVPLETYLKERSVSRSKELSPNAGAVLSVSVGPGQEKQKERLPVVLKTDTQGSKEAVLGIIEKLNKTHPEIPCSFQVIYSGVGDLSEGDVDLAYHAGALVIGLHVKLEKNAVTQAKERGVDVRTYHIIYKMAEDLEAMIKEHEEEKVVMKKIGEATVLKVFDIKGKGVIAGCGVNEGIISREGRVVCLRRGEKIGEGKITSLQRERKVVKEVHKAHECGFVCDGFHGWQEGDIVHCFLEVKEKRSA